MIRPDAPICFKYSRLLIFDIACLLNSKLRIAADGDECGPAKGSL